MAKRLSPEEAGKQIGCSAHCVRIKMQRGIWDLGEAYPPKKGVRSTWEYFIWQHKLDKLLGIEKGGIKMQRGIWDLGEAYPPKKGVRSTWEYFIWQHKLDKLLGIEKGGGQA